MEKLKLGLQKAEPSIAPLSKSVFHLWDHTRRMPAGVQPGADGTPDHRRERRESEKSRAERQVEKETTTYPWQCFLFMEGVLGFDGRLSGAVGEECTTWSTTHGIKT